MLDQLNSVYGLAYAMTRCPKMAEELSFHSFGSALKQLKAKKSVGCSPRVLLFRSLYQTLCGATSARNAALSWVIDLMHMSESASAREYGDLDWQSPSEELNTALDSLPIGLRFILYLWAVETISSREIAEVLEVPTAVVCGRLQQARELLYRSLTLNRPTNRYSSYAAI
jgi:DNA-directed RNA polymerase specialized sigma24 family protein